LFLMPGDLPAGSRLPFASLPRVDPADYPYVSPPDPMEQKAALPDAAPASPPPDNNDEIVRTALAVEPRDRLCVFMPPVGTLEEYVAVVAAVEATAAQLKLPVHV